MRFLRRHRTMLSRIPVAYFAVCITRMEDTEKNRRLVESWMEPARANVAQAARLPHPSPAVFGGGRGWGEATARTAKPVVQAAREEIVAV